MQERPRTGKLVLLHNIFQILLRVDCGIEEKKIIASCQLNIFSESKKRVVKKSS